MLNPGDFLLVISETGKPKVCAVIKDGEQLKIFPIDSMPVSTISESDIKVLHEDFTRWLESLKERDGFLFGQSKKKETK